MIRLILCVVTGMLMVMTAAAQRITIHADRRPAGQVFEETMRLADKNFVYPAGLLDGIDVTVNADQKPLEDVLRNMFAGTGISFRINGKNVILQKDLTPRTITISGYVSEASSGEALVGATVADLATYRASVTNAAGYYTIHVDPGKVSLRVSYPGFSTDTVSGTFNNTSRIDIHLGNVSRAQSRELDEVVVTADRNRTIGMLTPDVGHIALTRDDIKSTPVLFGEADVVKTLQLQPGVSSGVEGLAGMYVHGGANDENLYMLDNIPLYQINHLGGLFSAFNTEAIKNVDFYKSTFPVKYSGRLSSVLDVHTKDGNMTEHHGSFRLGLTSGAFNIDGPILRGRTTYSLAVRRSWFELLSVPAIAIYNSVRNDDENATIARYSFTDINAKITHRIDDRSQMYGMFYFGEDFLKAGEKVTTTDEDNLTSVRSDISRLRWGNLVGALGWNRAFSPHMFGEFTLAYTRYRSSLRRDDNRRSQEMDGPDYVANRDFGTRNDIADVTLRADMGWNPGGGHRVSFGVNGTYHRFLPERRVTVVNGNLTETGTIDGDQVQAGELNAYIGDDFTLNNNVRFDAGAHVGSFRVNGIWHFSVDPRVSVRWLINDHLTLKGAYSRMSQYVHQLTESSLSLPTDQWVPVSGDLRPQTCDKVSLGAYLTFGEGYMLSAEVYRKWMHNLIDYRDDYFLTTSYVTWIDKLCSGSGRAKGIDFAVTRRFGDITGQVGYSLLWSDRQFAYKNGGKRFPSRFDNRHKINISAGWHISDRWELNAAWTGQSGNRYTLASQRYESVKFPDFFRVGSQMALDYFDGINNRRLPFYHRLDLSANLYTRRGIWNFSLYNAYCNMNVISVRKTVQTDNTGHIIERFSKYRLIPIVPSVSFTWNF